MSKCPGEETGGNTQSIYEKHTVDFFDSYTPEYSTRHLKPLLRFVQERSSRANSFLDVGCGAGDVLVFFKENTRIGRFVGIDISPKYMEKASKYGFEVCQASILDSSLPAAVGCNYDYVLFARLLHHLIGSTRNQSKANVRKALQNSMKLLRSDGYLLILEPVFAPSLSMDLVFWAKRLITSFTSRRINILKLNKGFSNIGSPVVSYLGPKELRSMIEHIPGLRIVKWHEEHKEVSWIMRLGLIGSFAVLSCVVQKKCPKM